MDFGELRKEIRAVSLQYHKILVFVGGVSDERSKYLLELSRETGEYINLNKLISERLLDIPRSERAVEVIDVLNKLPLETSEGLLFLDYLDILFSPELKVNPLEALIHLSRRKVIIVSWPGGYREGSLIYAEPGHPEYYYFPDAGKDYKIIEF